MSAEKNIFNDMLKNSQSPRKIQIQIKKTIMRWNLRLRKTASDDLILNLVRFHKFEMRQLEERKQSQKNLTDKLQSKQ